MRLDEAAQTSRLKALAAWMDGAPYKPVWSEAVSHEYQARYHERITFEKVSAYLQERIRCLRIHGY